MSSIQVGKAVVSTDERGLVIKQDASAVHIDSDGLFELIDFLRSCAVNSFNRRRHFRIPLTPTCGLAITLHIDGTGYRVTPINFSLGGFQVGVGKTARQGLSTGQSIDVTLKFEDTIVRITATARRLEDRQGGFQFDNEDNAEVAMIAMELQRRWLARRAIHEE